MIKRIGLVLVCGLVFGDLNAQNFEWAKKGESVSDGNNEPLITVDASGNSYVFGTFMDTCAFGSFSAISSGSKDIFLCKYDSSGVEQWLQRAGGVHGESIGDLCTDAVGNTYITACFLSPANFGSTIISDTGVYIVKCAPTGALVWIQKVDSLPGATINSKIAVSASGRIIVAGTMFSGPKHVVCYDTSGTFLWSQSFISSYVLNIAFGNSNDVYITGAFVDSAIFGTTVLYSLGSQDMYLAKCNSNGSWSWALKAGSVDLDQGVGLAADSYGHVYVTGAFQSTITFGCGSFTGIGYYDIFVACYDTAGNCQWVQQAGGGTGVHYGFALCTDKVGNCIITGSILDTTHFGNITLIPGGENMYVAKYDSSGICQWAIESNGVNGDRGTDVVTDSIGNIYVTGPLWMQGIHNFGNFQLNAVFYNFTPKIDIFTAKINNLGTEIFNLQSLTSSFQIFPNPATSTIQLTFKTKHNGAVQCEIMNVMGERVFTSPLPAPLTPKGESSAQLDVSFLAKGIYVVRVGDGMVWENRKLVIE